MGSNDATPQADRYTLIGTDSSTLLKGVESHIRKLICMLEAQADDREGIRDTPQRFVKAMLEMTHGYLEDPKEILGTVFEEPNADEMIVVQSIPFSSLCEHHLLPFTGFVTVGYIPTDNRIVGLSKIPRLVHCFARRLQVQERLTAQIAHAFQEALKPLGVGVVIHGEHACMRLRGIQSTGTMKTSCLLGVMRDESRQEFLDLAQRPM